jgi:ATP-dependent DNA helicase RecG
MTDHYAEADAAIAAILGGRRAHEVESRTLDFKTAAPDLRATGAMLAEAAVCFANTLGGVIVLGVDDKAKGPDAFVGTNLQPDEVRRLIYQRTDPRITVDVRVESVGTARVLQVLVPEGMDVHALTDGRVLHRVDAQQCAPMPPGAQMRLREERSGFDWSAQPSDRTVRDVDPLAMAAARGRLHGLPDRRAELARLGDHDLLRAIGLVDADGRLLRAGELLLVDPGESAAPLVRYQYQATPGGDPLAVDRLGAPLLPAFQRAFELVEARRTGVPLLLPDGQMITLADYPDVAVREALANAVIHRDLRLPGPVDIVHSPTVLVISSPGPLVSGVTPHNILTHPSKPRNPVLASAFRTLGLAEETGRGVDRMYRESIRSGRELPGIEDRGDSVRVTFVGGEPNARIARFVAHMARDEQADTDTLLVLFVLCSRQTVTAHALAPVLQKTNDEVEAVLRRLAAVPPGILEPTRGTLRRANPSYRLRGEALSALGPAITYRRRAPDEIDRKVVAHVREYERITNRTVRNMLDVDLPRARAILADLVRREVLVMASERRRGPNIEYGPGPQFPADPGRRRDARRHASARSHE